MSAIDELLVQLDGTVDEVRDIKNVTIPMDFNLRTEVEALSIATDRSKAFIMRALIEASLSELVPKLDSSVKKRYADVYQDLHLKHSKSLFDQQEGGK